MLRCLDGIKSRANWSHDRFDEWKDEKTALMFHGYVISSVDYILFTYQSQVNTNAKRKIMCRTYSVGTIQGLHPNLSFVWTTLPYECLF